MDKPNALYGFFKETYISINSIGLCNKTKIRYISNKLINLQEFHSGNTSIIYLPDTIKNLVHLYCSDNVLISPHIYKKQTNNKLYLTFTNCQKKYKLKIKLRKITSAYNPKYIIGWNTKKQIEKIFNLTNNSYE
jgi:hypothetical protein